MPTKADIEMRWVNVTTRPASKDIPSAVEVFMGQDDAVVRLLSEIRDNQREEIAWRKKVMEESLRLQRAAVRWQRIALLAVALIIVAGLSIVFFSTRLFGG